MILRLLSRALIVAVVSAGLGTAAAVDPQLASSQEGVLFSFAQISDSQPSSATDQARFEQVLDTLVEAGQPGALIPRSVEFVMFAGDLVDSASSQSEWTSFVDTIDTRLTANGIPYRAVPGNHDRNGSASFTNYEQFIGDSGVWDTDVDVVAGHNGETITTGWSGLRIIGLNNSNTGDNEISAADLADIDQRVADASAANENILLLAHHYHNEGGSIPLATSLENQDVIGYMRGHSGGPQANQGLSGISNRNVWDLNSHDIADRGAILYYEVYETEIEVYPIQLKQSPTTLPTPETIPLAHALSPAGRPGSPTARFSADPISGPAPLTVQFRDTSRGSPTSWEWDFGDGGSSTRRNPTHIYAAPGIYTVALTATNSAGSDTVTRTDFITASVPKPVLSMSPASVDFGSIWAGTTSASSVTIENIGSADLTVSSTSVSGSMMFSVVPGTGAPFTLGPGEDRDVTLRFSPTSLGASSGTLTIASNDPDSPSIPIALTGDGVPVPVPDISVSQLAVDFGSIERATTADVTVTVENAGTADLTVSSTSVGTGAFSLVTGASPFTLTPGTTRELTLRFAPLTVGSFVGELSIVSNDPDASTVNIPLSGLGTTNVACPTGPIPFFDVSSTSFAYWDIRCIFGLDITTGTSATTYSPADLVTREQMAAFLARTYELLTATTCPTPGISFTDVFLTSFAYWDIRCIFGLDITTGTSATTYSPADLVTREQMAAFLARLHAAITGSIYPFTTHPFIDVSPTSFAYADIGRIYDLDITRGTSPTTYSPAAFVTREQMASFLARLIRLLGP